MWFLSTLLAVALAEDAEICKVWFGFATWWMGPNFLCKFIGGTQSQKEQCSKRDKHPSAAKHSVELILNNWGG